jgi:hypothetical protein
MGLGRWAMVVGCIVGGIAFQAASVGSVLYTQRATVTVSVPATRLEARTTLSGGPQGGDVQTIQVEAHVTETRQGTASPVTFPATYATGQVVFTWPDACGPPCYVRLRVPPGSTLSTAGGLHYTTQADVWWSPPTSSPVTVKAIAPGPTWNTGPGTITEFVGNFGDMTVTNPNAVSGGTNRTTQIVQQSDYDAVRSALEGSVAFKLRGAMLGKARGMNIAIGTPPSWKLKSDHAVGDEAPTFTMTLNASASAAAFSDNSVRVRLADALTVIIPPNEELTADPVHTDYQVQDVSPDGHMTVTGSATGYVIPRLAEQSLRNQIASLSPRLARERVLRAVPGGTVDIRTWPIDMPWLPYIADHIDFAVVPAAS